MHFLVSSLSILDREEVDDTILIRLKSKRRVVLIIVDFTVRKSELQDECSILCSAPKTGASSEE